MAQPQPDLALEFREREVPFDSHQSQLQPIKFAYAAAGHEDFVKKLVECMPSEKLALIDNPSRAFSGDFGAQLICNITAIGLYDVALYLIQRYPALATALDETGCSVLEVLAQKTSSFPSGSRLGFWERRIYSFIPLQVDENRVHPPVEQQIDQLGSRDFSRSWNYLIRAPGFNKVYLTKLEHVQALELLKRICYQISQMTTNEILNFFENSSILRTATKFGIVEIVFECIQFFPDQISFLTMRRSIFHIAVEQRKEKIFNLMYGMNAQKKILAFGILESGNNILHLAAKIAPSPQLHIVSGAALQMQRELQWFKEVEKIVQPLYKELENDDGETPRDVFTREHKELLEKGEKWMKDTSLSCMVVGTLIATVMFAGAFSVPGGNINNTNSSENGVPIFLREKWFMLFVISDALRLISSTISVILFLSILTSRYAEEDFLKSLPKRLMIGLATLFISIASLMVAFTASLIIVLSHRISWVVFPAVAYLPGLLFVLLQSPLLFEIVCSTYGLISSN